MLRILSLSIVLFSCLSNALPTSLPYCPEMIKPHSKHGLTSSTFTLSVTDLYLWPRKDRQNCKWDVFNRLDQKLNGVSAIFDKDTKKVEMEGVTSFEDIYILKGENNDKKMVYLSQTTTNSNKGNFVKKIKHMDRQREELKPIEIHIENHDFFTFFVMKGMSKLTCNGILCGCNSIICNDKRRNLKIKKLEFDENNGILTIHPDTGFNYQRVYWFEMDLDKFFTSKLTLIFENSEDDEEN